MASVCGSTLSLMDAGVPIKAPVAGVAMGLIKDTESDKIAVLTDIQGLEDFLGDMASIFFIDVPPCRARSYSTYGNQERSHHKPCDIGAGVVNLTPGTILGNDKQFAAVVVIGPYRLLFAGRPAQVNESARRGRTYRSRIIAVLKMIIHCGRRCCSRRRPGAGFVIGQVAAHDDRKTALDKDAANVTVHQAQSIRQKYYQSQQTDTHKGDDQAACMVFSVIHIHAVGTSFS